MATIAFIGLGIMGAPMAGHLVRAGHSVVGYNRSRGPVDKLSSPAGKGPLQSPSVRDADLIIRSSLTLARAGRALTRTYYANANGRDSRRYVLHPP